MLDGYAKLFNSHTRLVALAHVSNALGTINPVKEMIATAHEQGVPVLIDGAQDDIEQVLASRRKLPSLSRPAPPLKARPPLTP